MKNGFENQEKAPVVPEAILSRIKFEATSQPMEDRQFSIENISYELILCPSKNSNTGEVNGQPAEYSQPTEQYDIYIWEDLAEKIQRVLLFHEIVEIYFRDKYKMDTTSAHNATLVYEEPFKNEILSSDERKNIQELRNQYGLNNKV